MEEYRLKIGKMTCTNCSNAIEKLSKKIEGVEAASVSYTNSSGVFLIKNESVKAKIKEKIKNLGYEILSDDESLAEFKQKELHTLQTRITLSIVASFLAMTLMMTWHSLFSAILQAFLSAFGVFFCGRSFFIHAFKGLKNKALDMNTLVSLGTLSAFIYSLLAFFEVFDANLYFAEASMIVSFVLFGKFLEKKAQTGEQANLNQNAKATLILENGTFKEINAAFLQKNDLILVKEGEMISVGGVIEEGKAELDLSAINGEFVPVAVQSGDEVEAGALVVSGSLKIRATQRSVDSKLEQIKDMVFKASEEKIPIARLVDTISSFFVGSILLLAAFVFAFWAFKEGFNAAFLHMGAVLLISCPCALGLATPIALSLTLKKAAKNFILIKNPQILELLPKVQFALFDKTGTLSEEALQIHTHNLSPQNFTLLASLESLSSHPIAKAFASENFKAFKPVSLPEFIPASGLIYRENDELYLAGSANFLAENGVQILAPHQKFVTQNAKIAPVVVYFAKNTRILGVVCLQNALRKEAKNLIDFLKSLQIQSLVLSGDNEQSVRQNAEILGIKSYFANLKPEDKLGILKEYQNKGICLFVGDGLNDAPCLSAANISIAMNNASEFTRSAGDVILLKNDLNLISYLIKLAKKSLAIIKQNLFWAFFYNVLCIPVAAGIVPNFTLSPHLAALAMCFSSFFVVMNSLRIAKIKPQNLK